MNRISKNALVTAIQKVRAMTLKEKERLADEIYLNQPYMLGSCLVQKQFGVSMPKIEFLLELLFVCYQAMNESELTWPLISEDEQDRQLSRYSAKVKFAEELNEPIRTEAIAHQIELIPEKFLAAYVFDEINQWLKKVEPEKSDKYVILAAVNFVNCIAYVSLVPTKHESGSELIKRTN